MGYIDKKKQNAYQGEWLQRRRQAYLGQHGPCTKCGSWKQLEIHHLDPNKKISHRVWSWAAERREAELVKCIVVCHECHIKERVSYMKHGTASMYRHGQCRCDACRTAKVLDNKRWQ